MDGNGKVTMAGSIMAPVFGEEHSGTGAAAAPKPLSGDAIRRYLNCYEKC